MQAELVKSDPRSPAEGGDMVPTFAFRLCCACAACLAFPFAARQAIVQAAPYEFILRSRSASVTPVRTKDAQTGGGFIQVLQVEPNLMLVLMRGTVAAGVGMAGSGHHRDGLAALQFDLNQDFEVVPTRAGLRPPRLILSAWLIGALLSSQAPDEGGTASQSPACAVIKSGDQPLLNLCIKPHGVGGGQNLLVNDRMGPMEMTIAPGGYCLHQTLEICASQPKTFCHSGAAAAEFDPDPRMDSRWNDVLRPFRAVPHRDFGFRIILQVVEEPTAAGVVIPDTLHAPTPEKKGTSSNGQPAKP
jgi:hypothetical protein